MEGSIKELSAYRYSKALEDLTASEVMLKEALYKVSINRSYYAIFHAMRSITALDGYDSSKHSGIIAYFNQNFVKTGDFDKEASKIVKMASFLREKSDYEDFYIASKQEAEKQLEDAKLFLSKVNDYLRKNSILWFYYFYGIFVFEYPLEYVKIGCAGKSLSISIFARG